MNRWISVGGLFYLLIIGGVFLLGHIGFAYFFITGAFETEAQIIRAYFGFLSAIVISSITILFVERSFIKMEERLKNIG